jgi:hypothetical protein
MCLTLPTWVLAEQVQRAQGQTIMVESRPGAGTAIGTEPWRPLLPTATHFCSPQEAIFSSVRMFER